MRLVLLIIMIAFALPAHATEQECNYELTQPETVFIEAVEEYHPGLNDTQVLTIARLYELADSQYVLANDGTATESARIIAGRAEQIATKLAATQLFAYETIPEMEMVLDKMEMEKASGLKEVSDALKPEVRATAIRMIVTAHTWSELSAETTELAADSFLSTSSENFPSVADSALRTVCVLKSIVDVMSGVLDYYPSALIFAYVERLDY